MTATSLIAVGQMKKFFSLSREAKEKIVHEPSPNPQRGWSRKGAETTSKLRKDNLNGSTGDELTDEKVCLLRKKDEWKLENL